MNAQKILQSTEPLLSSKPKSEHGTDHQAEPEVNTPPDHPMSCKALPSYFSTTSTRLRPYKAFETAVKRLMPHILIPRSLSGYKDKLNKVKIEVE